MQFVPDKYQIKSRVVLCYFYSLVSMVACFLASLPDQIRSYTWSVIFLGLLLGAITLLPIHIVFALIGVWWKKPAVRLYRKIPRRTFAPAQLVRRLYLTFCRGLTRKDRLQIKNPSNAAWFGAGLLGPATIAVPKHILLSADDQSSFLRNWIDVLPYDLFFMAAAILLVAFICATFGVISAWNRKARNAD